MIDPDPSSHKRNLLEFVIPAFIGIAGIVAIVIWVYQLMHTPLLAVRRYDLDPPPAQSAQSGGNRSKSFYNSCETVTSIAGSWPCFRGALYNGVSDDTTPLIDTMPASGPVKLWSIVAGEGYAAAAVHNGRVYMIDYDQPAQADALRCFSLASGAEIWRRSYPIIIKRNHGISRTVPAVNDKYAVSIGPKLQVLCADAVTGDEKWKIDMVADYGATIPEWYAGQCPIIDNDKIILAPGGTALMIAVDLATGKVIWKTPNPDGWKMTHASILPVTIDNERMYIYCSFGGVVGVSAKDGSVLWTDKDWIIPTAIVPTPVDTGNGNIFLSGGYGAGSKMLHITRNNSPTLQRRGPGGGQFTAETLFKLPASTFGSDQQTPIFYQGYIYGVRPGGELVCMDTNGKQKWTSGSAQRFGLGPYTIADGKIYVIDDNGTLSIVDAKPDKYNLLSQAKILAGPECWGTIAIAGGKLIARDLTHIACFDIAKN